MSAILASEYQENDKVVNAYRTHGLALALGMEPKQLLSNIYMHENSNANNENGSIYITNYKRGMISTNTIVGAGLPISVGLGFGKTLKNESGVVWCVFGDGAATGIMQEALNIAKLHRLPIIFLCENNKMALCTPFDRVSSVKNISDYASVYGILGKHVNGRHVKELKKVMEDVTAYVRDGNGPALVEVDVPKLGGHYFFDKVDFNKFISDEDPVQILKNELLTKFNEEEIESIEDDVNKSLNEIWIDYKEPESYFIPLQNRMGDTTFQQAISEDG